MTRLRQATRGVGGRDVGEGERKGEGWDGGKSEEPSGDDDKSGMEGRAA